MRHSSSGREFGMERGFVYLQPLAPALALRFVLGQQSSGLEAFDFAWFSEHLVDFADMLHLE
jgi:hypothetical protein